MQRSTSQSPIWSLWPTLLQHWSDGGLRCVHYTIFDRSSFFQILTKRSLQLHLTGAHTLQTNHLEFYIGSVCNFQQSRMCEKFHQLLAVGRWFPPGTPVSSTRKLISSSSYQRLDMTLAVTEALNPNTPNPLRRWCGGMGHSISVTERPGLEYKASPLLDPRRILLRMLITKLKVRPVHKF